MDKKEFYDNLHTKLASTYNLTSYVVLSIRAFYLGEKKSRKDIALWASEKLHIKNLGERRKTHYQTLLNFVAFCSDDTWKDINQITEYDKQGDFL